MRLMIPRIVNVGILFELLGLDPTAANDVDYGERPEPQRAPNVVSLWNRPQKVTQQPQPGTP